MTPHWPSPPYWMRKEEVEQAATRPRTQFGRLALVALELWNRLTFTHEQLDHFERLNDERYTQLRALQAESLADAGRIRALLDENMRLKARLDDLG